MDSSGQPKIIDFGVARATDSDLAVTTLQTHVGQLIGTLQYMSPEQVAADPHDLDTRSDVYALGVVLYELLCGRPPHDLRKVAWHEALRVIREDTPARPSTISRTLRGDVETIALKAMEKDRARRYGSAAEMGEDLRRYLSGEPIAARPPSMVYQVQIFARKNRVVFGAAVAVVVALVAGTVATSVGFLGQRALRIEAQDAAVRERKAATRERDAADAARRAQKATEEALAESDRQRTAAEFEAYVANVTAAADSLFAHEPARVRARLDACPEHLRGWEWRFVDAAADSSLVVMGGDEARGRAIAVSEDGTRVLLDHEDGLASICDAETGNEICSVRGQGSVPQAAFSPDGLRVATFFLDGTLRVWDTTTGKAMAVLRGHEDAVTSIAFSGDGTRIVSAANDGTARVWDAETGTEVSVFRGPEYIRRPSHRGPVPLQGLLPRARDHR